MSWIIKLILFWSTSGKYHASVTSSFSKTKAGFFCFCSTEGLQIPLENWAFLHTLFLENRTMLFMTKQVILPKISVILQKWKSAPKGIYMAFCMKALKSPIQHPPFSMPSKLLMLHTEVKSECFTIVCVPETTFNYL